MKPDRSAHAVLVAICDAANRDGESAHPGVQAMVDGSGYRRSAVLAAVARLKQLGYVEEVEPGGGRGKAAVYRIPGVTDPAWRPETVQPVDGSVDRNGPASDTKPSSQRAETVQIASAAPITATDSNGLGNARAGCDGGEVDVDEAARQFEHFWAAYPKRDGKRIGKQKSLERWRRLSIDERRAARRGAVNLAQAVEAGGRFGVKDPERWLRDRCWEDWQEPAELDRAASRAVEPRGFDAIREAARERGIA